MRKLLFYLGLPLLLVTVIWMVAIFARPFSFSRAAPGRGQGQKPATTPPPAPQHNSYAAAKAFVATEKKKLAAQPAANRGPQQQAALFTNLLVNHLVPYWLGTPWNFNGTTQQPGEGAIACGYFVTTLLQDVGVGLNRVKLAQCVSSKLITTLAGSRHVKHYSQLSFEDFIRTIEQKGKGVTLVGLDFHTGLLVHDGQQCWFIHSNYIHSQGVVKELALESAALRASKTRMCGHITEDAAFLQRWVGITSL